MYARINLSGTSIVGDPGPLPQIVDGLADSDLADLSFLPVVYSLAGIGYWPVIANDPSFDQNTQILDAPIGYTVDGAAKTVNSARTVRALTDEELAPTRETLKASVMVKRDAEIDGGVTFNGVAFQTRPDDRENISGASQLAFMAIVGGAQPGDLRWHGGDSDFSWIALDNSIVTMDAQTVVGFGKAAAERKTACIFHAYDMKAEIDAAADPNSVDVNAGWPA